MTEPEFYKVHDPLPWETCLQLLPWLVAYTQKVGQLDMSIKQKRQFPSQPALFMLKVLTHEDKFL